MKILASLIVAVILLSGCGKNPSKLTCSVWNEKKSEIELSVNYWAELSAKRELTLAEKRRANADQDEFIKVLREMEKVCCPTE